MDRRTAFRVAALPLAASLLVAVGAGPALSTPLPSTPIVLPSDGDPPDPTTTESPGAHHADPHAHGTAETDHTEDAEQSEHGDHSEHGEHGVTQAPVQPETHEGHDGHQGQEGPGGTEGHVHEEGDDCGCGEEGHDSHGETTVNAPSDGTRQLVLGGFTGVNGVALGAAAFLRRRTASKRGRHLAARAAARPARSSMSGEER